MKGAIFMPKIIEKTSKNGVITAFSDGLGGDMAHSMKKRV
jgi:hypothetical protein